MGILGKISDALYRFEQFREENFERTANRAWNERGYSSSSNKSNSSIPILLPDIIMPRIAPVEIPTIKTTRECIYCGEEVSNLLYSSHTTSCKKNPSSISNMLRRLGESKEEKPTFPFFDCSSILTKKEEPKATPSFDFSFLTKKEEPKPSFPSFDCSSFLENERKREKEERERKVELAWRNSMEDYRNYLMNRYNNRIWNRRPYD